ncbi:MAG: PA0069 family radical SAM protein [Planctomycetota bacterium]
MPRPVSNPPNPWDSTAVEWLGPPPAAKLQVFEEEARSVVSKNDSPDLSFRFSANPYRGCQHACAYCYARLYHQYLGFGAGTDFDTKIVVKTNAAACLRGELRRPSWTGEPIVFSGATDCYQPLEASYRLTRACLKVCLAHENPVAIITKSALVRRDLDLLAELHARAGASVFVSIPFANAAVGRAIEPATPAPETRFQTLSALAEAGVPCGVSVAPMIPGLNDADVPAVLERAAAAGASRAFLTLVRLPAEVEPVFLQRLEAAFPGRARAVLHAIEEMRGGRRYRSDFGERMRGTGARWQTVLDLFRVTCRRLGLRTGEGVEEFGRPRATRRRPVQGELFP